MSVALSRARWKEPVNPGFLPAGEFGLTNSPYTWNVEEVMAQRVCPPKMMLGFVIRRCAVALGHSPSPAELAEWANNQRDTRGRYKIFGRAITVEDARVIMKNPGRLVTVRGAWPGVAA
jgi:hypothetical protein